MDRREHLTRFLTPQQLGIEIGPYWNPLVPKRLGFNCVILDVFDAAELRRLAADDPNIAKDTLAHIEEVDLVGTCTNMAELVAKKYSLGSFDYIVSSHNMEHMPDPITFLQECQKVLKPNGILSIAVPDRRTCFDYFRPHSTLMDWLEAYFEKRDRPTAAQLFRQNSLHSRLFRNGQEIGSFTLEDNPAQIRPLQSLKQAFDAWKAYEANPDTVYRDVHCWAFTPSSLELILRDLGFLGLIHMEIQQVTATYGNEFFLRLRNLDASSTPAVSTTDFYEQRRKLMHQINDEASENSIRVYQMRRGRDRTGSGPK